MADNLENSNIEEIENGQKSAKTEVIVKSFQHIDFDAMKGELKSELRNEIKTELLNSPRPDSILTKIWKLSPWATLIFLILSYIYSVKPVFDKYNELAEKEKLIETLQTQINIKKTDLQSFIERTDSLERVNKVQNDELNKTKEVAKQYRVEVGKIRNKIDEEKEKRFIAEKSATIAHLERFEKEIAAEKFKYDIALIEFDIREYCRSFIEKEINRNENDIYHQNAITALESFMMYKDKLDIDNSILYLSYYYEYVYEK